MPFQHLHGVTNPLAADSVVDWFATFQGWITATVGWVISGGAGTTNLTISSGGEAGGLLSLFANAHRDGGNPNRVRLDVQNDAVGTNKTTIVGYLDSGGVQFEYWMSADKDAMCVIWKMGGAYTPAYAGLLMPFALNPVDETYYMAAMARTIDLGTVLRFHTGAWDHNDTNYWNDRIAAAVLDLDTNDLVMGGIYHDRQNEIAGQYKFLTGEIEDPAVAPEDIITTALPPATTTWTIFRDSDLPARKFAMRTGGVLPAGKDDDPGFVYQTGNALTLNAFHDTLNLFLIARGWAAVNLSGITGLARDWEYHSLGTSGLEDIWVRVCISAPGSTVVYICDGAYPAVHEEQGGAPGWNAAMFPATYYMCGDADCFLMTVNNAGNYRPCWTGAINAFAPGLSSPYMRTTTLTTCQGTILLNHDGVTWDTTSYVEVYGDGIQSQNCNPNLYDATTYLIWPRALYTTVPSDQAFGTLKYFFVSSGGIANLDTITVGARVYTYFMDGVHPWLMRTV